MQNSTMYRISRLLMLILLNGGSGFARTTFLMDTFNIANSTNFNSNLSERQTGTLATSEWSVYTSFTSLNSVTISNNALQLKNNNATKNVTAIARLEENFVTVTDQVRIALDIVSQSLTEGISNINFGMAATDGLGEIHKGYSFRLDLRTEPYRLQFFDSGTEVTSMDVTGIANPTSVNALVINFTAGKTVSATLNGHAYNFGAGSTNYTGTVETENMVQIGWWGTPGSSVFFDNLTVSDQMPRERIGLVVFTSPSQ